MQKEDLLPAEEVCRRLGGICRRTLYNLVARGEIAAPYHVGRRAGWLNSDVEACQLARPGLARRRA